MIKNCENIPIDPFSMNLNNNSDNINSKIEFENNFNEQSDKIIEPQPLFNPGKINLL